MNLWGRGSPRFPFLPPVQASMEFPNYETFQFQNPAWEIAGFNPMCAPVAVAAAAATPAVGPQPGSDVFFTENKTQNQTVSENSNTDEAASSPSHKDDKGKSHNFWQYKPPGTETEEDGDTHRSKRDHKDGKASQHSSENSRRVDKHERSDRHRDRERESRTRDGRDRERDRSRRSRSRDRYDDSPRNSSRREDRRERSVDKDRDQRVSSERKGKDSRDYREEEPSSDRDQYGREQSRCSGRRSRERKDRSPKRKREDDLDDRRRRDDRGRDRDRDDENHSKRYRSDHGGGDGKFSLEAANYKTQTPNETVMIRGLAQHITENDIRQDILQCGMMPKDIRLIRKKETGASRGFAFVEFNSTDEARYWMEMKQGVLMFQDQYRAVMQFSIISNDALPTSVWLPTDWDCPKCFAHNFKKRVSCFKCHAPRPGTSDGMDCSNEVSPHPTTKLILMNLDVLTNEEDLLKEISNISNISIQSCQIGRDSFTQLSRGVCYLEMKNVLEAIKLYNALTATELLVDGRKVNISYCKLYFEKHHGGTPAAMTQQQWAACGVSETDYTLEDVPRLAEYSAQIYATTPQEHATYLQYYTHFYTSQLTQPAVPVTTGTGTNAAAAVAQSAIKQAQSKKAVIAAVAARTPQYLSSRQLIGNTTVGEPDVASYTYDDTSGYYFDQHTGLYYDANSQYYYHSQDQVFLYWDAEKRAYMPAPTGDKAAQPKPEEAGKDDKKKDKEKGQDKVKVAKRIAKDMERWAKTLNQKKEVAKMNAVAVQQAQAAAKAASTADVAFSVLERKEAVTAGITFPEVAPPTTQQGPPQSNLVASYGGGSDSEDGGDDQGEDRHTDWTKMACLLCKRQFPTKEALLRHQQLSDLHKQNLEAWNVERGGNAAAGGAYRDRAKERRQKFGIPDEPKPNRLKEKYLKEKEDIMATSYEEPTKAGIPSENVGSKMLQKMGWSEGMGLGRCNQGRTEIIEATHRVASAGLGVKGGNLGTTPVSTNSYKDNVKRSMMARYNELND